LTANCEKGEEWVLDSELYESRENRACPSSMDVLKLESLNFAAATCTPRAPRAGKKNGNSVSTVNLRNVRKKGTRKEDVD